MRPSAIRCQAITPDARVVGVAAAGVVGPVERRGLREQDRRLGPAQQGYRCHCQQCGQQHRSFRHAFTHSRLQGMTGETAYHRQPRRSGSQVLSWVVMRRVRIKR